MTELNLSKLQSGNKKEFKLLVSTYQKPLYFFVFKIMKDHDATHDVLQETLIRAYKYIHKFQGKSTLKTWIFQIASNCALTELKKIQQKKTESLDEVHLHSHPSEGSEAEIIQTQFHSVINKSMSFLTPTQQIVFRLRHLNGLSTKEAAEHMKCSESNIKKQLFLALNRIRDFIKKNYPEYQLDI
jgi:RNA polymerase sigma-70 factor (ECF subfamily)